MPSRPAPALPVTLYRHILRLARLHDKHPTCKALLPHPRTDHAVDPSEAVVQAAEQLRQEHEEEDESSTSSASSSSASSGKRGLRSKEEGEDDDDDAEDEVESVKFDRRAGEVSILTRAPLRSSWQESPQSPHFTNARQLLARIVSLVSGDGPWRQRSSPTLTRWIDAVFGPRDMYLPEVNFQQLVKKEARRTIREVERAAKQDKKKQQPNTQHASEADASEHAHHSISSSARTVGPSPHERPSHSHRPSRHAPPTASSVTADGFAILRWLNLNAQEGTKAKILFSEDQAKQDPAAIEWNRQVKERQEKTEQNGNPSVASEPVSSASSESSSILSLPPRLRMRAPPLWSSSRPSLRSGVFLVAHPRLEGEFGHSVVLILNHSKETGARGVIVNRGLNGDEDSMQRHSRMGTRRKGDHERGASSTDDLPLLCSLAHGGPVRVQLPMTPVVGGTPLSSILPFYIGLHRIPALSELSIPIIEAVDGQDPVWQMNILHYRMLVHWWQELRRRQREGVPASGETRTKTKSKSNGSSRASKTAASKEASSSTSLTNGQRKTKKSSGIRNQPSASFSSSAAAATTTDTASSSSSPSSTPFIPFYPSDFVVYSGLAHWSPGQLEREIDSGSWILTEGSGAHVFMRPPEDERRFQQEIEDMERAWVKPATAEDEKQREAEKAKEWEREYLSNPDLPTVQLSTLDPPSNRPDHPFPMSHLWSHAMHVHGGEFRHWAHMYPPASAVPSGGTGRIIDDDMKQRVEQLLKGKGTDK